MRNLRFRRAARTSALGTVALLASLSLTACQGDAEATPTGSSAPAGSQTPAESSGASGDKSSEAPAADQGKDSAGSDSGSGSGSSKPSSKPQEGNNDSAPVACTSANTKLTMTEVKRPINHMLLTVTNVGSEACSAYHYAYLKFGEAQSVPRIVEDSKPQAVATINPGESAYTGVMTSSADGSGTGAYSTKDLQVGFQSIDGGSDGAGPVVEVALGKSAHVDSTLAVTYWQMSMDDALMY